MENNQQNRGRQDQEQNQQRSQSNENNLMDQQNNESLNTASQQPVQDLREQIDSGRSYDYGAQNSPEEENERDAPRH